MKTMTLIAGALLALSAAAAHAGPVDDCSALLPGGVAPVYVTMPASHTELCRPGYVLSHDNVAHEPRWVAWKVTAAHLAMTHIPRTNDFEADPALPAGAGAKPADYARSGFDQGHMSDAEDNAWSEETEHDSFLMSNMVPQTPANNRQVWRYIENWTRAQATKRGEVYVISGPVFVLAGHGAAVTHAPIGSDHVVVPAATWKVVIDTKANVAWGFVVDNDQSFPAGSNVAPYQQPIAVIEAEIGMTLPLPPGIDKSKTASLP